MSSSGRPLQCAAEFGQPDANIDLIQGRILRAKHKFSLLSRSVFWKPDILPPISAQHVVAQVIRCNERECKVEDIAQHGKNEYPLPRSHRPISTGRTYIQTRAHSQQ